MPYLIVSDIHGNYEALEAVLEDARGRYDSILCLGDLVGYGADPNASANGRRPTSRQSCAAITTTPVADRNRSIHFNPAARPRRYGPEALTPENRDYLERLAARPLARPDAMTASIWCTARPWTKTSI